MQFVGDTISEYLAKVRKCLSDNHGFSKDEIDSALDVVIQPEYLFIYNKIP